MSDPGTSYRTRMEVAGVRKERDPITSFKDKLVGASVVTNAELKVNFPSYLICVNNINFTIIGH